MQTKEMRTLVSSIVLAGAVAVMLACATAARAGMWVQSSCANPDGSASLMQGWQGAALGAISPGSSNSTNCSPGAPAGASLGDLGPAATGSMEYLVYSPPAGSTLAGGQINVLMAADATGTADGVATVNTPTDAFDGSDLVYVCSLAWDPCSSNPAPYQNIFSGTLNLPARGGDLYLEATCGGNPGTSCSTGDADFGTWSTIDLNWAELQLSNDSSPTGSGFSGTLLTPNAHGTTNIAFTAGDPGGPGVYQVTVEIDGTTVYQGTPDTNSGACQQHGSFNGYPVFDYAQPCEQTESVDIPVSTATLSDGTHRLQVFVSDAAGNVSTVVDQAISTLNRTTTSSTLGEPPPTTGAGTPAPPPAYVFKFARRSRKLSAKVLHRRFSTSPFQLAGTLLSPAGVPVDNVPITIQAGRANGTSFHTVATGSTDGAGRFTVRVPAGDSRIVKISAGAGVVAIREKVSPNMPMKIKAGRHSSLVFTGRVAIRLHGQQPQVTLADQAGKHWQPFAQINTNKRGAWRYVYYAPHKLAGFQFTWRAQVPGASDWTAAHSKPQKVAVPR